MRNTSTRISRAIKLVWTETPLYIYAVVPLTVVQGFFPLGQLYLGKLLIDRVADALSGDKVLINLEPLIILFGLQVGLSLLETALSSVQEVLTLSSNEHLAHRIKIRILEKSEKMGVAAFEDSEFYDELQNAFQEAGSRPLQVMSSFTSIIRGVVTLSSFVVVVWTLSPWIVATLVMAAAPEFWIRNIFGKANYWMLRWRAPEMRRQQYYSHVLLTDYLVKEVKLFNLEPLLIYKFNRLFKKFFAETMRLYRRRALAQFGGSLVGAVGRLGAFLFVARAVLSGTLTVGDVTLVLGAISQFRTQVSSILGGISGLYEHSLFISNLFHFLDAPGSGLNKGKPWTERVESVEFQNVSFSYPGSSRKILSNISFKTCRGETIGIVGHNGAGKTTLIKLLSALYRPTSGRVLFNGTDTAEYSQRTLQTQISATFQDFGRYQMNVKSNIAVSDVHNTHPLDAHEAAAKMAGVNDYVDELPKGFDTQLGRWFDEGEELSGGQWQKIALARSYYRDAPVIILDEPTAALDPESEYEIYKRVRSFTDDCITFLISHRLASMRLADKVLVLSEGSVVEQGNHSQLMQIGGEYRKQFDLQAEGYV